MPKGYPETPNIQCVKISKPRLAEEVISFTYKQTYIGVHIVLRNQKTIFTKCSWDGVLFIKIKLCTCGQNGGNTSLLVKYVFYNLRALRWSHNAFPVTFASIHESCSLKLVRSLSPDRSQKWDFQNLVVCWFLIFAVILKLHLSQTFMKIKRALEYLYLSFCLLITIHRI